MKTLFNDLSRKNSAIRNNNIAFLKENGFTEGGLNSRSGELYFNQQKNKCQLIFGMRYNIGGKQRKYFSLSKDFNTQELAISFFNELRLSLQTKNINQ